VFSLEKYYNLIEKNNHYQLQEVLMSRLVGKQAPAFNLNAVPIRHTGL